MSQAGFDVQEATIDGIHAAMQSGALTCRALVEEYLRRIEAYDRRGPNLNAIQSLNSRALDEADALDAELRRSGPRGPLHGIPVAIKDQVEVLGMPTTYGSALFRGFVPKRDATVVQRIKAAGGIVLAKTNMGEFAAGYAGSAYGVCRNPYDPARDPSGSSSGSGVAVSANMAAVAVGEDTFGSVRGPAARNCIVGLRPTLPLVSRFGMMPATPTRDTLGPLARTVRDAALLLDVMAGYDPNDPITASSVGHVPATYTSFLTRGALPDVRVGVIRDALATDTDPQAEDYQRIRDVIDRALRDLAGLGVDVVDPLAIPGILDLMADMEGTFESEEATNAYLAAHPDAPARTLRDIVLSPQVLPYRRARLV
ncbi:MAG TPA: amidase family protein, partial [Chloroflexota bacterium]|nr:amidase family protein [Chloroflexota bacterium]